ncbi:hypothetical protein [Micrococcus sp.]|uniref:hypothetical protein n=1 Tax=Micrococcus sp. TaxID=1271 RepID=UPI0026DC565C|nr:hypothetical protein [Micrococcus sp.]MDO4240679.1 hypothetical protein [Micrococcus sp.]
MPTINPTFDAPWMPTLQNITGLALGTFLVILVLGIGAGVLMWILGKLSSNGRAQEVGVTFMVWSIVAAALIAGATSLVAWGMGLPLF